jgi:hypothetical protein
MELKTEHAIPQIQQTRGLITGDFFTRLSQRLKRNALSIGSN